MKKTVNIPNAPAPVGPYSQAIIHNDLMIASGQIAINPVNGELKTSSIAVELNQILKNIDALLESAELKRENIPKCSILLKTIC